MKYSEIEQWLWEQAKGCATTWYALQVQHPFSAFYLYFKPGELVVDSELPAGYELAYGQRIAPNQTIEQCQYWIISIVRKLPILTPEMAA